MKNSLLRILCLLLAVISTNVNPVSAREAAKPNIVFFLVDDLGWSDVGCFGSSFYETPNIDALAEEGVKFTNAYAACHVCSPTRASILTGKYPATINLTDWLRGRPNMPFQKLLNAEIYQHLPYSETTIAEVLKDVGYQTAIIGKWHLGQDPSDPMAHGFDMHIPDWPTNPGRKGFHQPHLFIGLEDSKEGDYLTDRLADKACEYIEANQDKPFFLYMAHFSVHDPIQGRKDLVEKYKKKLAEQPPQEGPDFILEGNPDNPNNPSKKEIDKLMKKSEYSDTYFSGYPNDLVKVKQKQDNVEFAGMVESVDQSLGRIVAKLKELGIDDNTIIIFSQTMEGCLLRMALPGES